MRLALTWLVCRRGGRVLWSRWLRRSGTGYLLPGLEPITVVGFADCFLLSAKLFLVRFVFLFGAEHASPFVSAAVVVVVTAGHVHADVVVVDVRVSLRGGRLTSVLVNVVIAAV